MNPQLLRIYQQHIIYTCQAMLFSQKDLEGGTQVASEGRGPSLLWYGVQNLVIGAGNLSKALWGTGRTKQEAERRYYDRLPLRQSLQVTDASPLRRVKIRNDYEHLDERIEEWWAATPERNFVELIGPRDAIHTDDSLGDKDILRWFDPTTGDIIFWGNELSVPVTLNEVRRILPLAIAESRKPRWDGP
jgi:hypothetical protein